MVDIDPDAQVVSEIWGLSIEIEDFLRGEFQRTSFQYMWTKMKGVGGIPGLGARFQSVLTNVIFGPKVSSGVAHELKDGIGVNQQLSIAFNLDLMDIDHLSKHFTYGRIVGSIGIAGRESYPYFNVGRMMKPIQNVKYFNNFQFILSELEGSDKFKRRMLIDLGNSLPIDKMGHISLEHVQFGIVTKTQEISCDNANLRGQSFKPSTDEYRKWSGIYEISIPPKSEFDTTESRLVLAEVKIEVSYSTYIILVFSPGYLLDFFFKRLQDPDTFRNVLATARLI